MYYFHLNNLKSLYYHDVSSLNMDCASLKSKDIIPPNHYTIITPNEVNSNSLVVSNTRLPPSPNLPNCPYMSFTVGLFELLKIHTLLLVTSLLSRIVPSSPYFIDLMKK